MAVENLGDGIVRDDFTISKNGYTYRDAIVMNKDDYKKLTAAEIEAMKQSRFDNWYKIITTPAEIPPDHDLLPPQEG
jgi:hypothetical protein